MKNKGLEMEKTGMARPRVVAQSHNFNDIQKSAALSGSLKTKGNFERIPHLCGGQS